jgi:hypothetical protein
MTNGEDIYILEWDKSKYLVLSSALMLLPSVYAYLNNLYWLSSILFGVSFISINFWRKATYSIRRNIDICLANAATVVFAYNGFYYFVLSEVWISMFVCSFFIAYYFYLSNILYKNKDERWYKYHLLFHIGMIYNQTFVIYTIVNYEKYITNYK